MIYSEGSGYAELLHILQSDTAHIGKWFKENRLTVMLKKVGQWSLEPVGGWDV